MGHGRQVILAIIADDPGVGEIQLGIRVVKFQNLQFSVRDQDGEGRLARLLLGALGYAQEQPGPVVEPEDARIQQAFHRHSVNAGPDVARPQDGVFSKAFRDVSHA